MKKAAADAVKALIHNGSKLMTELNFNQNYFELLGLPVAYSLDEALLHQRQLTLLKQVHPDRFAQATPSEQRLAVQYTSLINDAVTTLRSPIKRAIYLLKIQGITLDLESNTFKNNAFLMEQIQWREQIADSQHDQAALIQIQQALQAKYNELLEELTALFAQSDAKKNHMIAELIMQLLFFERLLHEINLKSNY